jgi:hypothetical protein
MASSKEIISNEDQWYDHTFIARVRFDANFIRDQTAAWKAEAEHAQRHLKRNYDQFFAQINNYPKPDRPSHMCVVRSDYQTVVDGLYICTLIIVTGDMKTTDILCSIVDVQHAYLHMPMRPFFGECFLETATQQE